MRRMGVENSGKGGEEKKDEGMEMKIGTEGENILGWGGGV